METLFKQNFNAFFLPVKLQLGHQQTEGGEEAVEIWGEEIRSETFISERGESC